MHTPTLRTLFALGAALFLGSTAVVAVADDTSFGRAQAPAPLEGTWLVSIRPYICETGETIPGVVFRSRLTFHAGGTMTEITSNPFFEPGQRSAGLGAWERIGRTSYRSVFEAFIMFTGGGYERGVQHVDQGIEMLDADHWVSSASVVFRDEANAVVPPTGCMNASGERLQ